jgi:hypothetical protein
VQIADRLGGVERASRACVGSGRSSDQAGQAAEAQTAARRGARRQDDATTAAHYGADACAYPDTHATATATATASDAFGDGNGHRNHRDARYRHPFLDRDGHGDGHRVFDCGDSREFGVRVARRLRFRKASHERGRSVVAPHAR